MDMLFEQVDFVFIIPNKLHFVPLMLGLTIEKPFGLQSD